MTTIHCQDNRCQYWKDGICQANEIILESYPDESQNCFILRPEIEACIEHTDCREVNDGRHSSGRCRAGTSL